MFGLIKFYRESKEFLSDHYALNLYERENVIGKFLIIVEATFFIINILRAQMSASNCYLNILVTALIQFICIFLLGFSNKTLDTHGTNAGIVFPAFRLYLSRELHHQSE